MKKEYSFDELLSKAASYCAISEHCISEVDTKLRKWDVDEENRDKIISRLIEDDFINEVRYSRAFVSDKFRLNKWGKIKISMALVAKGLPKDIINEALKEIDEGEYNEMLATILKSKLKTITYNYEYERQGKLFRYAQSRGFETHVIDNALRYL